jgi:hypothetical protein
MWSRVEVILQPMGSQAIPIMHLSQVWLRAEVILLPMGLQAPPITSIGRLEIQAAEQ